MLGGMNTTATREHRAFVSGTVAGLLALVALPAPAGAQSVARPDVREEILGYDSARSVLVYVERTQSIVASFAHVAIVEVSANGTPHRNQLTTPQDLEACRPAAPGAGAGAAVAPGGPSPLAGGASLAARGTAAGSSAPASPACAFVESRVRDQITAARARLTAGVVLPVTSAAPSTGCSRVFAPREFSIGTSPAQSARFDLAPDGQATTLTLASGTRRNAAVLLPVAGVTSGSIVGRATYDRLADARQIPGTSQYAVLLRSDSCTPENAAVPALAMLVPAPPPPEEPMVPLGHAELSEAAVLHAVAPRARRSGSSWADNNGPVTYDNAWTLPDGRVLVQYTHHSPSGSPSTQFASFALFDNSGGRLRYLTHVPPSGENPVFTGSGQEAFAVDLDHDGRSEVFLRTMTTSNTESGALIAYDDAHLTVVWRGRLRGADPTGAPGITSDGRRCVPGLERDAVVLRCTSETPGVPQVIRRLRFNGGAVSIVDER